MDIPDGAIVEMLGQQPREEDLPVAMPLAVDDHAEADENFVDAMLLNRHVQIQGTSFLYGMIQDQETACCNLGWGSRSCRTLCQRIEEEPNDVYYQDARGRTPLHELCLRCPCLHVVTAILEQDNQLRQRIDDAGNTPLHLINHGFSTHAMDPAEICDILNRLLDSTTASICNREGNSALHMACMAAETVLHLGSIQKILHANRASAARVNNYNQTPLSLHCQRRQASTEVAKLLIEAFPDAIPILDSKKGWGPLHYAASNGNLELIRLLLHTNPTAASLRTKTNETPLHVFLKKNTNEANLPAINLLLEAEPRAAMVRDSTNSQFTPLHLACKNPRVPFRIVAAMVEACPKAASVPDSNDYLPIHHACEVGTAAEVVELLWKAYPESAVAQTKKKDSALSLACSCNKSTATVAFLIQANPNALTEKNHYGFVPLHCVCGAVQPRMGIVEEILRVCPSSVVMKSHGGESAIHIASGNPGTCVGVIELLTAQYESFTDGQTEAGETNKAGSTPCKLLSHLLGDNKYRITFAHSPNDLFVASILSTPRLFPRCAI
jgi:ankyrin repeat protein